MDRSSLRCMRLTLAQRSALVRLAPPARRDLSVIAQPLPTFLSSATEQSTSQVHCTVMLCAVDAEVTLYADSVLRCGSGERGEVVTVTKVGELCFDEREAEWRGGSSSTARTPRTMRRDYTPVCTQEHGIGRSLTRRHLPRQLAAACEVLKDLDIATRVQSVR